MGEGCMGLDDLGDHGRFSDPSLLVMSSLADGPKHGYAMTKDIQRFAGVVLGPGTLYGALARLQHQGLIEALPADDPRPLPAVRAGHQGPGRPAGGPPTGGHHRPAPPGPGVAARPQGTVVVVVVGDAGRVEVVVPPPPPPPPLPPPPEPPSQS